MKKIINIRNIGLVVILVLISVIVLNTKEVKATGTVTWSGPSSITIRGTISHIAGPVVEEHEYDLLDGNGGQTGVFAIISYTASDIPINYSITKSTVMSLSGLTFTKPGDYTYYIHRSMAESYYKVIVSARNVVDANNVPTGNYTASFILQECTYNEQTDDFNCTKVSPDSGVLYADFNVELSAYELGHIELSKTVTGIGADTTKYFPFTISINNDHSTVTNINSDGWIYPISGIDSTVTYNGNTISNPTTIADGTPTTIYLKHGQTAIIGQATSGGETFDLIPYAKSGNIELFDPIIPPAQSYDYSKTFEPRKIANIDGGTYYGSYYTIEENPADYTASYSVNGDSFTTGYSVPAKIVNSGTNTVDFVNNKEMSVVTGIILTTLPYLILAGIGVGGTLLVMHLKNEEKKAKA